MAVSQCYVSAKDYARYFAKDMDPSLWVELLNHPGIFVSAEGRIFSFRGSHRPRLLKGGYRGRYPSVTAPGPYVHRAVCETFHGPQPTPESEVRHLDGNPDNNDYRNLAWGTGKDNAADRVRHGTDGRGERNPMARLTRPLVTAMRQYREETGAPYWKIAERFGISTMTAYRAITGQSWK